MTNGLQHSGVERSAAPAAERGRAGLGGGRSLSVAFLSHVASPHAPTGAERSLALLAAGLRSRGHRVVVLAPDAWSMEPTLADADVEVLRVASRPCWLTYYEPRPLPVALAKWLLWAGASGDRTRIASALERWKPDVVHVNCLPHLHGAAAASSTGRPVVWHLREILPPGARRRWLARALKRDATRIVAVSEAVGQWVRDEGLGDRLSVVPNGVEVPEVVERNLEARRALGLPEDGVAFGLFGQLVPHKGALDFVAAAGMALRDRPDARFVIAGPGPDAFRARVRQAIGETGHGERFHLLPPQPSGERLVAASDVVCLTTTTPDPFPRAVLEAMALSKPIAAYRSGGTPEMVDHGVNGLLVEPGDVEGLASAFVELAGDSRSRASFGTASGRLARERFSLRRHLDIMEALLRGLRS